MGYNGVDVSYQGKKTNKEYIIESLLSSVVSDGMISGNHRSNTKFIAQGIANIIMPFFDEITTYTPKK